jgi:hypothetical protein
MGLVLLFGMAAVAAPAQEMDGSSPETAIPLVNERAASGTLMGQSGGAFRYYSFPYAGDSKDAMITLHFAPRDNFTATLVGVNVYQGNLRLAGIPGSEGDGPGSTKVTFYSSSNELIVAQVYNYRQGLDLSYELTVTGAAPQPDMMMVEPTSEPAMTTPAVVAPPQEMDGSSPETAIPLVNERPASGTLMGQSGGAFRYYSFPYAGDSKDAMITLHFAPRDDFTATLVGVNVYQGNLRLAGIPGSEGDGPGSTKVTFYSSRDDLIVAQVYNYRQGLDLSYEITVIGAAPQPDMMMVEPTGEPAMTAPSAPAVTTPAATSTPTAAQGTEQNPAPFNAAGTSGSLTGDPLGRFAYYWVEHPGDGTDRVITYSFSPVSADNAFGIEVWQGNELLGRISGSGETRGQNKLTFYTNKSGGVLLKVNNYTGGTTVNYNMSMTKP